MIAASGSGGGRANPACRSCSTAEIKSFSQGLKDRGGGRAVNGHGSEYIKGKRATLVSHAERHKWIIMILSSWLFFWESGFCS